MKKLISNIFAATGLTIVMLALVASLYGAKFLCITSVYQVFTVNIIIFSGLNIVKNIESKYFIVEVFRDVTFMLCILISAGYIFNWYDSTPLWVIIIMCVALYTISCTLNIVRVNDDIKFINNSLKIKQNRIDD